MDQHLGRWVLEPCRVSSDRDSEINFRRLRALAEEVAGSGVRLGGDMEMPVLRRSMGGRRR